MVSGHETSASGIANECSCRGTVMMKAYGEARQRSLVSCTSSASCALTSTDAGPLACPLRKCDVSVVANVKDPPFRM